MDKGPLVSEQIQDGAKFLALFQKHVPVQAAFWLKDPDDGYLRLYVVSDQITDDNFDVLYGRVGDIALDKNAFWFDPFQVKLLGVDDPLARDALAVRQHYPPQRPLRFTDKTLGGLTSDEVYFYPLPIPALAP